MNSKRVEYHTPDFIRKFIYSDWYLLGLKALPLKLLIIIIALAAATKLHLLLFPVRNMVPFAFFYLVVFIAVFFGGSIIGVLTTIAAIIINIYFIYGVDSIYHLTPHQYVPIIIFFVQGIFISLLIDYTLRLIRRLRRQADLLSLSHDAVIVRDVDSNKIIFWNYGAQVMYGYSKEEAIGNRVDELLKVKFITPIEDILHAINTNGSWEGELIHCKKNGKQIIVNSRWVYKKQDLDRQPVMVEINSDITKQIALEKRKDEFLSIASHELKTPLTSVKAFTQILESRFNKIGDRTSKLYLSKMNIQVNKLTSLVNDLLDSTRIQAGKLELNMEFFRIDDLIEEVIDNLQLTTSKHTIKKIGGTREMVWADRNRTEQVIVNLITNAIKYSPRSDIVNIHISQKEDTVIIGVEDRGIGIPKNKLDKIFDRFYRVESREGEFTGLGLGLYISYEIIQRQHGKMWVESEEKIGSTFYFTLQTKKIL